jgi:hypothetical protein
MRHVESNITFRPFKSVDEAEAAASQIKKFRKRYGGCLLCRRAGARVEWQE